MTSVVTCGCGKRYRVSEKYVGKTVRCASCQGTFQVPASIQDPASSEADTYSLAGDTPVSPKKSSVDSPPRQKSEAGTENTNDLTVTREYVPSGICGRPWMVAVLAPLAPLSAVFALLGSCIGCGIYGLVGLFIFGKVGMLMDMTGATQKVTGGLSTKQIGSGIGAEIGIVGGAFIGQLIGTVCIVWMFNRLSHNRSPRMSWFFGILASSATFLPVFLPFIFDVLNIQSLPAENLQITWFNWVVVAAMMFGALIGLLVSNDVLRTPYCEQCHSYLKGFRERKFPMKGSKIVKLAQQGAAEPLINVKNAEADAKNYSTVSLKTCEERCCAYLRIVYHWESREDNLPHEVVTLEGFLDGRRARVWNQILKQNDSESNE